MLPDGIRNNSKSPDYKLGISLLAFFYAYVLANYVPMDSSIKDRMNYLEYAGNSEIIILGFISKGYLNLFVNEPIWLSTNIVLNQYFEPETTLRIIIFFTASVTAYLVLSVNPRFFLFLLFILIFPQVIVKSVVHIRQGFAISIFLLGWFTISKPWRWLLFSLTPLIHASFFIVLFLCSFTWFLNHLKLASDLRMIATVFIGLVVGLGLAIIASFLGVRQASEYEFTGTDVSGLGFLFWLCILVIYWSQGREFAKKNTFAMVAIGFYLTTYFLVEVTARIFESMFIIVLLASLGLTSWRRIVFIGATVTLVVLSWSLRLNQPVLGLGAGS